MPKTIQPLPVPTEFALTTSILPLPLEMSDAPLAQLDRASDYGSEGWGFDSLKARHRNGMDNVARFASWLLMRRVWFFVKGQRRYVFGHKGKIRGQSGRRVGFGGFVRCARKWSFQIYAERFQRTLRMSILSKNAPLAQSDRASVFGTEGWGFESLKVRHD